MSKNLRFGFVAREAILSCLLAQKGFTGPLRVVEGQSGLRQVLFRGDMDLERLSDLSGWRILRTTFKSMCLNGATAGHVSATLAIVKENDLKPGDIAAVRIKASPAECRHTTTLSKKYPRNAESADHSSFYATAIAIKERDLGPESFRTEKFIDPVVLDLIEKITVEPDPSMPEYSNQGISEITTKDGRRFQKRVDNPHGFGNDPLTDRDLEDKFRKMAARYMGEAQIQKLIDAIWNVEALDDMCHLTRLMVFPPR